MLSVTCPSCDKKLQVKDELAGRKVKCPGCQTVVAVPAAKVKTAPRKAEDNERVSPAPSKGPAHGERPAKKNVRPARKEESDKDEEEKRPAKKGGKKGAKKSSKLPLPL